jgi:hypothetical protein
MRSIDSERLLYIASGIRLRTAAWLTIALAAATTPARDASAQGSGDEAAAEFFLGTAWSVPLPLILEAPGKRLSFRARYSTRPFADAPYYAYRAGIVRRARGGEVELVHHKLYLENPVPPIEHLEITHGYNLSMANLAMPAGGWQLRIGLGFVVAHPEGRIGGRPVRGVRRTLIGGGYHVAGGSMQIALGRRYPLGRGDVALAVAPEAKLTAGFARVQLQQGTLIVPNIAVHVLGGLGVRRRW